MSKRISFAAAAGFAALVALPAVSQAHCLHFNRLETRTASALDCTGRTVRHLGDGIVRAGDRMFGWLFCKGHRV
ncbi:MAG TPA: hypothetical protein VHC71_12465 [Hyphomicrobium sp.]|jgi:hypothetical protein|nr:hypothetical protein [Hyphomicrobium sp.]